MGEEEEKEMKWFSAEKAKTGRANCKRCKGKIDVGTLRIAKLAPNPFGSGMMSNWHHPKCFFDSYVKAKATTRRLRCPEDELEGWDVLPEEHRVEIIALLGDERVAPSVDGALAAPGKRPPPSNPDHKDHTFREFRRICAEISNTSAYTEKTAIVKNFLEKGTDGHGFQGDVHLLFRMLLPMAVKRVYNLHNKQLIKLFSKIFGCSMEDMLEHLEQGDISETIREFFEDSETCPPLKKSNLTLQKVDEWLEYLSKLTREEDQSHHFVKMTKMCTSNDLKMVIRLIVHDIKTSAGPKHVLEALHPDAYRAFQTSRDLDAVINKVLQGKKLKEVLSSQSDKDKKSNSENSLGIGINILTPVLPMLAEVCRSVEYAMKKCPNGMISEIKYDGERVQVHKKGKEFKYFSRSLKPVVPHKVAHFKDFIPKAFPHGDDLILDSEVLLIDTETGKPLPFGTLGVHKKTAFKTASVCLFVFDCLYYNGKSLLNEPICERRKLLRKYMNEIQNHIVFSETQEIHDSKDLETMISKVLSQGLEGIVLKDLMSFYEPGKRHWLKIKKDYLRDGAMADSADLIVLGAWFGSGSKGGMMSIFLMGCWDPKRCKFCTVTKVHGGHDDKTLERLQTELKMVKISKDQSKVPDWLVCTKAMVPDFVSEDPKKSPVWAITGAEFTQHEIHTADGISVRFPRVSAIRSDKTWKEATSLPELQDLYKKSKVVTDFSGLADLKEGKSNVELGMEDVSMAKSDDSDSADEIKLNIKTLMHTKKESPLKMEEKRNEKSENEDIGEENKRKERFDLEYVIADSEGDHALPKNIKGKRKSKHLNDQEDDSTSSPKKRHKVKIEDVKQYKEHHQLKLPKKKPYYKHLSSDMELDLCSGRSKSKPKKPLPNIFKDVKIIVPPEEESDHDLKRYFEGYGGTTLDKTQSELATHIIYSNKYKMKCNYDLKHQSNAKVVQLSWLLHSIQLKELQNINNYLVNNQY